MILQVFYHVLAANEVLNQVIAGRIHYEQKPQGTADPCLVLQLITSTPGRHMTGRSSEETAMVRVNCLTSTSTQAADLARLVSLTLEAFEGQPPGAGAPTVNVRWIHESSTAPLQPVTHEGKGAPLSGRVIDFRTFYLPGE